MFECFQVELSVYRRVVGNFKFKKMLVPIVLLKIQKACIISSTFLFTISDWSYVLR